MCYPFLMCTPSPLLTGVIVKEEGAHTSFKYEIEEFNIKTDYFLKLVKFGYCGDKFILLIILFY